jgi:peptidoglycan/xylan/chitin deacetylase (PgdA/CDA1 family)
MQQPLRRVYLLYHELRPGGSDYSYVVSTAEFERHLDLFVRLREQGSAGLLPEITFDDGHVSNFEYALPALQSRGLKARFFITAGWTGSRPGYMEWEQLRGLHAAGQAIGAHGWSHTLLTHCDETKLREELGGTRKALEDKLGAAITTMSLPGGRYNRRVLTACEAAGYTQVYTSIPKAEPEHAGMMVGRLNIRGDMSLEWIGNLLQPGSTVLAGLERQYRMKAAAKALLGDGLYERLWALLNKKEQDAGMGDAAAE